jgi:ParB family chromosome partitioning protein
MKKNVLGRGLDALMPQEQWEGAQREIPVTLIDLNPDQPRRAFDPQALQELADSIREMGLLQPIVVRPMGGRYQIVAGERRYRAARQAGLTALPCIEKAFTDEEVRLAALIENLQRQDLNPMEQAVAIRSLMDTASLTQEEAARRLGKSRSALANTLRLLTLPDSVQQLVRDGALSEGHARVLAGIKGEAEQLRLAQVAIAQGLSVRALELLSTQRSKGRAAPPPRLAPELQDLADRLHRATGVRTQITGDLQKGKITLNYKTPEELQSLYDALEQVLS